MDSFSNKSITDDSPTDDDAVNDPSVTPNEYLNRLYIIVLQSSARSYKRKERRNGISYWGKLLELFPYCILLCPSLL